LALKAEVSLIKIYFTTACSILNCLLLNKKLDHRQKGDLVQTWRNYGGRAATGQSYQQNTSGTFENAFLENQESIIKLAFEVVHEC